MRFNLGEFEEIVLLVVAAQNDKAYGLSVTTAIEKELQRSVTMSSVHTALYRLEEKGLVKSEVGGTTKSRGGRRKRIFMISAAGKEALLQAKDARTHLWSMIPKIVFESR
ncbi:MAG: helix-turn-helix transcriptional regulator [Cyclobacteriaceae bacterium]